MDIQNELIELVQSLLQDEKHFIVQVEYKPGNERVRGKLKVLVDGDEGFTIDSCGKLSRALGEAIETRNIIPDAYNLEVSSPGVDTPLESLRQYKKNVGRNVNVFLTDKTEAIGTLTEVTEQGISISYQHKEKGKKAETLSKSISFSDILKTKVLISFK